MRTDLQRILQRISYRRQKNYIQERNVFFPDIFIKSFLNCLRNETDKDAEGDGFDIVNKHCEWTIRKVDDIALDFDRD